MSADAVRPFPGRLPAPDDHDARPSIPPDDLPEAPPFPHPDLPPAPPGPADDPIDPHSGDGPAGPFVG